jgi:glycine/D-amino acid oxidase-like deaminating enzyme
VATLPGRPDCCWTATAPHTSYPPLSGLGGADVGVIGAGIVGLTAAYLLASAGISVAVVEALRVGRQVTGRSTRDARDRSGATLCRGQPQRCAPDLRVVECDLESKAAYAYARDPTRRDPQGSSARRCAASASAAARAQRAATPRRVTQSTSSARASSVGGTVGPSAFAV